MCVCVRVRVGGGEVCVQHIEAYNVFLNPTPPWTMAILCHDLTHSQQKGLVTTEHFLGCAEPAASIFEQVNDYIFMI